MGKSRAESSSPKTNNRLVKGLFGFQFMLLSGLGLFFFGWDSFCFSLVAFVVSLTLMFQAITSVEVKQDSLVGKNKQYKKNKQVVLLLPEKPSSAPLWIGILIIIVGLFMALGSIRTGGNPSTEKASFICGASLLVGMIPIGNYIVLGHKHSRVVEKKTEAIVKKRGIHFPPKVSIIPLFVSCCLLFGSFFANWMKSELSEFLFFGGVLLLIYYLLLVIKRENRVKELAEEM